MSVSELMLWPVNRLFAGKGRRSDIAYGPDDLMSYDEYPAASPDAPLVIFWYGSGWKGGHKETYRFAGRALQKMGVHAFVVDYPKYPTRVYPGFLDDAVAAVSHIVARYPGRKVVLMGHSSGGHTALLVAMRQLVAVDGIVAMAAPCTIDERYWRQVFGDAIKKGLVDPRHFVDVTPDTLSFLLLHGTKDAIVSVQDSLSLDQRLQAGSKKSQLMIIKRMNHVLIVPFIMLGLAPKARRQLEQYLKSITRKKG